MKILSMDDMTRKLLDLKDDCLHELETISIDDMVGNIDKWYVDKRATKRLGVCKHRKNMGYVYNEIGISSWLLKEFDEKTIKNTIMHEILHTFEGCNNHGRKWQQYARLVNRTLGYNIKTYANMETLCENNDMNYDNFKNTHYKYKITCKKCGETWYQQRLTSRAIMLYKLKHMRHTGCGGNDFIVEDIKLGKVIVNNDLSNM